MGIGCGALLSGITIIEAFIPQFSMVMMWDLGNLLEAGCVFSTYLHGGILSALSALLSSFLDK